jgi:hypothetical protein
MARKIETQFEVLRELTTTLRTKLDALGDRAPDDQDVQELVAIAETLASVTNAVPVKDVREFERVPREVRMQSPETPKTPIDALRDEIFLLRNLHVSHALDSSGVCDLFDGILDLISDSVKEAA